MTSTHDPSSPEPATESSPDALHKLHRMSRTAGLGDTEYVAVNVPSVAALFFGIGSALVVFDPIFSVMPIAALVLAIIALRQISRSNATQTGRGLAWGGIITALLFSLLLGSRSLMDWIRHRRDEDAVVAAIHSLGSAVSAHNYEAGYALMSHRFTERVPLKDFSARFEDIQNATGYDGAIKAMDWSGRANFDVDNRTDEMLARTIVRIEFKVGKDRDARLDVILRKSDDQWKIDDLPTVFPTAPTILTKHKPPPDV